MIVPATRLLIWFAVIAVPFATLAGVIPEALLISIAAISLFVAIALVDVAISWRPLRGVSMKLAPLVRATQARPFSLSVRVQNADETARTIRVAIAFPPEIVPAVDEFTVALPAGSEWSVFDWSCTALRRGKFPISSGRIEARSTLGFWHHWKTVPLASEARVYPNLARERSNLAALFLNRGAFGVHAQRQIGRGREFEKLREYNSGDGIEDVHWKATAKRGHPVTKVFQIERTQEVYVIVDASRLSARTSGADAGNNAAGTLPNTPPSAILDRFITAALVLGHAAEQQGDLFGLLTFSDKIESFLRARNGKAHYHACRDALYTLQPREVTPDFEELSTFIRLRLRRRALLLFLTSLDDPVTAEAFVRSTDLLSRQHLVLVNMLQPSGVQPLFTNENVSTLADLYAELAGHMRWQALRELEKILQRRGVRLSLLPSARLAVDLVSQYISVKQRQAL
jgi:uncharacterized protein (DUF58 family)